MMEIAEQISEAVTEPDSVKSKKGWGVVTLSILLSLISILFFSLSPGALKSAVREATEEALYIQIEPMKQHLDENTIMLERLEEIQSSQVLQNGIAGYKKFEKYSLSELPEKLESSTQNSAAINIALRVDSARTILYQIDPERTKYFEEYFCVR